jgi:hypothetical protein
MWEHPANMSGGKWTYSIPKKDGKKLIDDMWLYTVLAMIGENFEAGDQLCGAVIRSVLMTCSVMHCRHRAVRASACTLCVCE